MEEMVENGVQAVADDTQFEGLTEVTQEPTESLDIPTGEENQPAERQEGSEPGWIRKRVDKAVQKAIAETEARMQAQFNAQMAPIRERMLAQEAQELVDQGTITDFDTAMEFLRLKQGVPAPEPTAQPRDERGRFTPKIDPTVQVRANMLLDQAKKIQASRGVDVLAEFNTNPEAKRKVITGEWDFYDIADSMAGRRGSVPAPMRSPNGASGSEKGSFSSMTAEQLARFDKGLEEGRRYNVW